MRVRLFTGQIAMVCPFCNSTIDAPDASGSWQPKEVRKHDGDKITCAVCGRVSDINAGSLIPDERDAEIAELKRRVTWWRKACKTAGPTERDLALTMSNRGPCLGLVRAMALQFKRLRAMVAPWEE
jgi:hypothetical protein